MSAKTRRGPGLDSPGALKNFTGTASFTNDDSPSPGQMPASDPSPLAEYKRVADRHARYLASTNRLETFNEQAERISRQADPAVADAVEQRRAELARVWELRSSLRARRQLREDADRLIAERPGYHRCEYSPNNMWSVEVREYDDGTNEVDVAQIRCKSAACAHCGPYWLADWYSRVADRVDVDRTEFHVTVAPCARERSTITRRLADRHRNHGEDYAAVSVPTVDGRFVIVSTMPTPSSSRADYSEALSVITAAFDVIFLTARETGANPTPTVRPSFCGRWKGLTNSSPEVNKRGADCEEGPRRRHYLANKRPDFGVAFTDAAIETGGKMVKPTSAETYATARNVDLQQFEPCIRGHGAVSTLERARRRQEHREYLDQIENGRFTR